MGPQDSIHPLFSSFHTMLQWWWVYGVYTMCQLYKLTISIVKTKVARHALLLSALGKWPGW